MEVRYKFVITTHADTGMSIAVFVTVGAGFCGNVGFRGGCFCGNVGSRVGRFLELGL